MNWHLVLAASLALLLPIALIVTGAEIRRVRLRVVEDLRDTVFLGERNLPQLVLALARYQRSSRHDGRPTRLDEVRQWAGAFFYGAVCLLGFSLLFNPVAYLVAVKGYAIGVPDALFWQPTAKGATEATLRQAAAIAGAAFLGGYVFNIRYLIRQTLNQELSALAFVRSALRIVHGMIVGVVVYHVGAVVIDRVNGDASGVGQGGLAAGLAVAFVLGYLPDRALDRIARLARITLKNVDERVFDHSRIVSLEAIDGIDHEISYRLQESNLFDIQNLATINPIELYAETPYTLLQCFDWILQAQLCLVVGVDGFFSLKRHKIRTIFDLERAVLSRGAPAHYLQAVAEVLLPDAIAAFRTRIGMGESAAEAPAAGGGVDALTLRHMVAILSDDLHVHRLRLLWLAIARTTGGNDDARKPLWLFDTDPLPGDPPTPTCACQGGSG